MKVMHVVVAGDLGGAERFLVDLASRPAESRATHVLALFTPNARLYEYFRSAGLDVRSPGFVREHPLAYLWRSLGPSDVKWLTCLLRNERADVLHMHTLGSHMLGVRAARRSNVPTLRTEHAVLHYFDPTASPFTRWAAYRTQAIVCISEYVSRTVQETARALSSRLCVIRNGVDTSYFSMRPFPTQHVPFRFGVVSRLERVKGISLILDALALVDGALLEVVGDGSERSALEAHAAKLGLRERVQFHGYQRDPRPYLAGVHACVSASEQEGLGLSVLESMSCGRPVVALAAGGLVEIIEDGVTGVLVRSRSTSALARAMRLLATRPEFAHTLGLRAHEFVVSQCSIRTMCEAYGDAYRDLVAKSHDARVISGR